MSKKQQYRFCVGPWNFSQGQDPYGPTVRREESFDWKLAQLKTLGFDAMMFHDDDAVPDIDTKTHAQVLAEVAGYDAARIADLTGSGLLASGPR